MTLKKYQQKRNFTLTKEPKGTVKNGPAHHLFVIQKHAASHLHYDLRLEMGGVLKSWAVPKGPCLDPSVKRLAIEVEDHPLDYGSFEGTIPKGQYGGGTVMLWDKGYWESDHPLPEEYKTGAMRFELKGSKLAGAWKLIRLKNSKQWLLIKVTDDAAKPLKRFDVTEEKPLSVTTHRTMAEIA